MRLYDPYGTLTAGIVAMRMHRELNRGSGRTGLMVSSAMETGGTIVCTREVHGYIEHLVRSLGGAKVRGRLRVMSVDPTNPQALTPIRHGPVYFDHEWLYQNQEFNIENENGLLLNFLKRYPSPLQSYDRSMHKSAHDHGINIDFDTIVKPLIIPKGTI